MTVKIRYSEKDGFLRYLECKIEVVDSFRNGIITGVSEKNWNKFFKEEDFKLALVNFFPETDNIARIPKGKIIKFIIKVENG